jgi:hypothetical protein
VGDLTPSAWRRLRSAFKDSLLRASHTSIPAKADRVRSALADLIGRIPTPLAVNTSDVEQTVPFWFPIAGDYGEELHGGSLDLSGIPALQQVMLTIPSHFGRIWTSIGTRHSISTIRNANFLRGVSPCGWSAAESDSTNRRSSPASLLSGRVLLLEYEIDATGACGRETGHWRRSGETSARDTDERSSTGCGDAWARLEQDPAQLCACHG